MSYPGNEPPTPFELNVEFEDLDAEQQKLFKDVLRFCLRKIAEARNELHGAQSRPNARVARHFKIVEISAPDRSDIVRILDNYNRIIGVLLGHERVRYDGEETGPAFGLEKIFGRSPAGYVWSLVGLRPGETGEIKLVKPRFVNASFQDKGRIIIHEVAHRFLGMRDYKYYRGSSVIGISRQEAMSNADTYANFAIPAAGEPPPIRIELRRPTKGR